MAKPRPISGIQPDGRLAPNARKVLAVRIAEVYSYDRYVADPRNVTELHDMRIACKRLRYLLEIFDTAFDTDVEPFIDEVKDLQDILGDIHDCDVQVPMLEDHLRWIEERERESLAELLALPVKPVETARAREHALSRFRDNMEAARRADERPGVHTLIAMRRVQRDERYNDFITAWRRLKSERFRARLEAALGI